MKRNRLGKSRLRRGTSAAECAFCIPVVLLLTFATLEICSAIFVKETATIACYEGARVGVKRRATADDAFDQCQSVLDARGVVGYEITITPSNFAALDALDVITIQVSVPTTQNSFFIGQFLQGRDVSSSVTMVREFDD